MEQTLRLHIQEILGHQILDISKVTGGDISDSWCIRTSDQKHFVKTNTNAFAKNMFSCEAKALELIGNQNKINTPNVTYHGKFENTAFLILDFIEESKARSEDCLSTFGISLASMHDAVESQFGFEFSNYIGTLSQSNDFADSWSNFYIAQRLEVQVGIARDKNYLSSYTARKLSLIYKEVDDVLADVSEASLLHGDLWSGNYLIDSEGKAFLIDPASYYGDGEVDIAMTELFGRFPQSFYEAYTSQRKLSQQYPIKRELYQLYYLLVHLNLFGRSYEESVSNILEKYL